MARLKKQESEQNENGKGYFGDKDMEYLKKESREAVEGHHNSSVLYFQIDWERSKRNFYGEMTTIRFKNPKGTKVRGKFEVKQGDVTMTKGIPNKMMTLTVSVFKEQLKELNIDPTTGDYFGVGKRFYYIYDKTIADRGSSTIMMRDDVRVDFFAYQVGDEGIQRDVWGDNLGQEEQINQRGNIIK